MSTEQNAAPDLAICGVTETLLWGRAAVCVEPAGHPMPHRNELGTTWQPVQTATPNPAPCPYGCDEAAASVRAEVLSGLLRGMARRQVRTSRIGDMLARSYDEHVALLGEALKRSGWTAGTSVNALKAALDEHQEGMSDRRRRGAEGEQQP